MADPNQTPGEDRFQWACPCAGCSKAVKFERSQLVSIIKEMKKEAYSGIPYDDIIAMIESRNPKPKPRK